MPRGVLACDAVFAAMLATLAVGPIKRLRRRDESIIA